MESEAGARPTQHWPWTAPATFLVAASLPQVSDYVQGAHVHWGNDFLGESAIIFAVTAIVFAIAVVFGIRAAPPSGRAGIMGIVFAVLGLLGVVAFYVSLPIILGGAAGTLGWHALAGASTPRGRAVSWAAVGGGILAALVGITVWLVA